MMLEQCGLKSMSAFGGATVHVQLKSENQYGILLVKCNQDPV